MSIKLICIFGALISFLLSAFSVPTGRINTQSLGFAFLVLALLIL